MPPPPRTTTSALAPPPANPVRPPDAHDALELLARAGEILASSLDWDTTLDNVMSLALPELADFGFFDVRQNERDEDVRRIARAHEDPRRQAILEQSRWVRSERRDMNLCALSSGAAAVHADIDEHWLRAVAVSPEHLAVMRELAFRSMLTVPIVYGGRLLGALTLFYADSGRRYGDAELALAQQLAGRAAAAVENARLFKEANQAIRLRDDFLSVASHELRTPLSTLRLHTDLLARQVARGEPLPAEQVGNKLAKVQRQIGRLDELVDHLLDVSRLAGGRLQLERARADLAEIARDVVGRFTEELDDAGCTLRVSLAQGATGTWDRARVDQVLTNLLTNALKYGKGAPIAVTVSADDTTAWAEVRDHGIGIAPADQARIFGRFERAVSDRNYGGLGLGLWIARQIVEAHDGRLSVESQPGAGAAFRIELPR